jgi:hypothetical protein
MRDATEPNAIVVVDPEDLDYAREIAAEHGVEIEQMPIRGIEPVSTITLVLLGGSLAVGTVVYLLDKAKGGQVIDLRQGVQRKFYRTDDVAYGLVVIIASDGTVTVEVKEPRGLFGQVIDALTKVAVDLGESGIDTAAEAARATVGDNASIAVQRVAPA